MKKVTTLKNYHVSFTYKGFNGDNPHELIKTFKTAEEALSFIVELQEYVDSDLACELFKDNSPIWIFSLDRFYMTELINEETEYPIKYIVKRH